jgi:hypothetical protein
MGVEHQRLLARIRNHENDKQVEPQEQLVITPTLSSVIEASGDYIEDSKGVIARNEQGKVIRIKLKLSLSFKGGAGAQLKNV